MRKFVSAVMASAMVMSLLAGCGNGGSGETTTAGTDVSTTVESTSGSDETSASGDSEVFRIGGIGPITGENASYGMSVKQGAEIAIEEINKAGGVTVGGKTYQYELIFADDEATPDKAIQAYNSVMDKKINALMGTVTTGSCMAIMDLTNADNILQITPSASAIECTRNPNAFRICFTDPIQGSNMADYMVNKMGIQKIAVIYNNSDEYSSGIRSSFEDKVAEFGGTIVSSEAFTDGDVDFNTQLTKIKGTDAEAIFVPAYYQDITYITKQAYEMGLNLPFFGSDGWDGVLGTVTDTAAVEGAIFLSPFFADAADDKTVNFVNAYQSAYGAIPDQFAADAYDTIYVMKAAMEKADSINSAAMISAMSEIQVDGITGSGMTFDENGDCNKDARFLKIVEGKYTIAE